MDVQPLTILLATDGSQSALAAGRVALTLTTAIGASLHVIHAWHVPADYATAALTQHDRACAAAIYQERGRQLLVETVAELERAGGPVQSSRLRQGQAATVIADEAATIGADLIVTGSRGWGQAKRVRFGSIAEGVVRRGVAPVLVIRGHSAAWPPASVVIGDDGSVAARDAIDLVAQLLVPASAEVVLLRAVAALPPVGDPTAAGATARAERFQTEALGRARDDLARHAAALIPLLGHAPAVLATVEEASIALLQAADTRDKPTLLVVGTRGTAPAGQLWLGSTALRVLTCASGPVLVCPQRPPTGEAGLRVERAWRSQEPRRPRDRRRPEPT